MAAKIGIITDSTCDLPLNLRAQYEITVVPLTVVWGQQQYLDGVELSAEDFYARLEQDPDPSHHLAAVPAGISGCFYRGAGKRRCGAGGADHQQRDERHISIGANGSRYGRGSGAGV